MINDKYSSFEELCDNESGSYEIEWTDRNSHIVIIAPHGGNCEPETTNIARGIADKQYNFYSLTINKGSGKNKDLHITSHKFNEPKCLELVSKSKVVIAIHGCKDSHSEVEGKKEVFIGGLDTEFINRIEKFLKEKEIPVSRNSNFLGQHHNNICNKGLNKQGIQFEFTKSFRNDGKLLKKFIEVIQQFLIKSRECKPNCVNPKK